jgi:hypothetical protein
MGVGPKMGDEGWMIKDERGLVGQAEDWMEDCVED